MAIAVVCALVGVLAVPLAQPSDAEVVTTPRVEVSLASVTTSGERGSEAANVQSLTGDGRVVLFSSTYSFDGSDTTGQIGLWRRDLEAGTTERVDLDGSGSPVGGVAADSDGSGTLVVFQTRTGLVAADDNGTHDIYLRDINSGSVELISAGAGGTVGDGQSVNPVVTPDGRYVLFRSAATNLVSDDTNGLLDLFLKDRTDGSIERVNLTDGGAQSGETTASDYGVSADGRYVVWADFAGDLTADDARNHVQIYLRDRTEATTTLISKAPDATAGNANSSQARVSDDGTAFAYVSAASNLVAGDTNGEVDVFVHEVATGSTERVSVASDGSQASGRGQIALSGDGQVVAFHSRDTSLHPDAAGHEYQYLHDRSSGETLLLSRTPDGLVPSTLSTGGLALDADGSTAALDSPAPDLVFHDTNDAYDVFVASVDRSAPAETNVPTWPDPTLTVGRVGVTRVPIAWQPAADDTGVVGYRILVDGRSVDEVDAETTKYTVEALPPGTSSTISVEARDVAGNQSTDGPVEAVATKPRPDRTVTTRRASLADDETEQSWPAGGRIDPSGRYVLFSWGSSRGLHLRDREAGTTTRIDEYPDGSPVGAAAAADVSEGAARAAFRARPPSGGPWQLYVRDLTTDTTTLVSAAPTGSVADADVGLDARLSDGGRFVVFTSAATNLVAGDDNGVGDVFLHDFDSGTTERISVASDGTQGDADSGWPSVSRDGRYVVFESDASTLVSGDTNGVRDVFLRDRATGTTVRINHRVDGSETVDRAQQPAISADGSTVAFASSDSYLVPYDHSGGFSLYDVFVTDVASGTTSRVSVADDGDEAGGPCETPALSAHGRFVAFTCGWQTEGIDPLVPGDSNDYWDVVRRDRALGITELVSVADDGTQADADVDARARLTLDAAGTSASYVTEASTLVAGDTNGVSDVFATTLSAGASPPSWPTGSTLDAIAVADTSVDLEWTPATDDDLVTGYRIYVDDALYDEVDGDRLTATVGGLSPATTYGFQVQAVDVEGNETTGGPTTSATTTDSGGATEPPAIDAVTALAPRPLGLLPPGATVDITVTGDPGHVATTEMAFTTWDDGSGGLLDTPRSTSTTVALTEGDPGTYHGSWTLPDRTAELTSISGTLDAGDGLTTSTEAPGPPWTVAGWMDVTLDAPVDSLPGYSLVAAADGRVQGTTPVSGGGTYRVPQLTPAADYTLEIRSGDWRLLHSTAAGAVRAGLGTDLTVAPPVPATLRVHVEGPDGPIGGADVLVTDAAGEPRQSMTTDSSGDVPELSGFTDTDQPTVTVTAPDHLALARTTTQDVSLDPGANLATITIDPLATGTIQGRVTDHTGSPGTSLDVVASQQVDGRSWTFTTTTDADGNYTLDALAGDAQVDVATGSPASTSATVAVPAGGTVTHDVTLTAPETATVTVELFTKYPGDTSLTEVPMDSRTAVHFDLHVRDGRRLGSHYPLQAEVHPDTSEVTVCIDGAEAGLPAACEVTALDGQYEGAVRFELVAGGGMTASLQAPGGSPLAESWTAHVRRSETDGWRTAKVLADEGAELEVLLAQPGTYDLELVADSGAWFATSVTVPEDAVVDLGSLRLNAPGRYAAGTSSGMAFVSGEPLAGSTLGVRGTVHNGGTTPAEPALEFPLPADTTLLAGSVTVDGEPATASHVGDDRVRVPAGTLAPGATAVVRLRLDVETTPPTGFVGTSATMVATGGGARELVGLATAQASDLSLRAPRYTRDLTFEVSGAAPPGATVDVRSDGATLSTATAGEDGAWSTSVTLPDLGVWHRHQLVAASGSLKSPRRVVQHDPTHPEVTALAMRQPDGRRIEVDPRQGASSFPYTFVPGSPLLFEVEFASPDRVVGPYVAVGDATGVLTRGPDGIFRTSITASSDEVGDIHAGFSTRLGEDFVDRPQPTVNEFRQTIPVDFSISNVDDWSADTSSSSGDAHTARVQSTVDLGPGIDATLDVTVRATQVTYTVTPADAALVQATGVELYGLEARTSVVSSSEISGGLTVVVPPDAYQTGDGSIDTVRLEQDLGEALDFAVFRPGDEPWTSSMVTPAAFGSGDAIADGLQLSVQYALNGNDLAGALGGLSTADKINQMQSFAAGCGGPAGERLQDAAQQLEDEYIGREALKLAMNVAAMGLSLTGPQGVVLGLATALMGASLDHQFKQMVDGLRKQMQRAVDTGDCQPPTPDPTDPDMPPACRDLAEKLEDELRYGFDIEVEVGGPCAGDPPAATPVWIHDPSGYLYEGVASNRVDGVTATLLSGPTSSGPWEVWDADPFGQHNPQTSDPEGRYGWDVPEGWWQVAFGADGYLPTHSEPLEVLPPHFDVNIGLIPEAPPVLDAVTVTGDGAGFDLHFSQWMRTATLDLTRISVTDAAGADLGITIDPVGAEDAPDGTPLAKRFRIRPHDGLSLGQSYTITVHAPVENHAGRPMADAVTRAVTVEANRPPHAANDAVITSEDATLAVDAPGVLDNDTDADGHHVTAALASGPHNGTVTLDPDGSFVYEPATDFSGTDTFTYRTSDEWSTSDPATVTITVGATNDPAVAQPDTYEVTQRQPLDTPADGVLGNDRDPEGDALSALVLTGPSHGALTFPGDGSFTYTPETEFVGTDFFTYQTWDGTQLSTSQFVTLEVLAAGGGDDTTGGDTSTGGDDTAGDDTSAGGDDIAEGDDTTGSDDTTEGDTITEGEDTTGGDDTAGGDTSPGGDDIAGGDTSTDGDRSTDGDTTGPSLQLVVVLILLMVLGVVGIIVRRRVSA